MPTLHLPAALAPYAGGQRHLLVPLPSSHGGDRPDAGVTTVATLLSTVGDQHPGVRQRVLTDLGDLRPHVNVFVNGESIRFLDGLATTLSPDDEVWVIPAVSGGSGRPAG
jgi:molybdopterin synthase sulfur carrier subunit